MTEEKKNVDEKPAPDPGNTPIEELVEDISDEELDAVAARLREEGL